MQYRTLTAEQLAKLPPKVKCRMMKEIIKGNMRFIPEGQVTAVVDLTAQKAGREE